MRLPGNTRSCRRVCSIVSILTTFLLVINAEYVIETADPVEAVKGLVSRVIPEVAADFEFAVISQEAGKDVFQIRSLAQNRIFIEGSSAVAMASGLNHYLKYFCNAQALSWSGSQLAISRPLPPVPAMVRVASPMKYSYYQNVCTVSYSFAWWQWSRWEQEIDWMALNGINLPLAFLGQEKIWLSVWSQLGLTRAEINEFFSGPAFYAWQRMGNIQGWGGPLPQSIIDQQFELQLKILARMRSLGMVPVLPAFAGFVPAGLKRQFPDANLTKSSAWGGFSEPYCCDWLLNANDPLFKRIGALFIDEMTKAWGTDHIYNCDTFNENKPPSSDPAYLKASSAAVYSSMTSADKDAIWLMQGWLFVDDPEFWKPAQVQGLLSGVPNSGMIILDLFSDVVPVFSRTQNYYGKPFLWCMLHNFGGHLGLFGRMNAVARHPIITLNSPGSTMIGVGLTMEGINQNYVLYELVAETYWNSAPINVDQWLPKFVSRRYGNGAAPQQQAWALLRDSVYNCSNNDWGAAKSYIEIAPRLIQLSDEADSNLGHNINIHYDPVLVQRAAAALINAARATPSITSVPTFRNDIVDVMRQAMSDLMIKWHSSFKAAYDAKDLTTLQSWGTRILQLIDDFETLLATDSHFLLGRWLADARTWGVTAEEKALCEFNARNQITLWGPTGNINDYASKQYSGLVRAYYRPRWALYVASVTDAVKVGKAWDESAFQRERLVVDQKWQRAGDSFATTPVGDAIAVASALYDKYFRATTSNV